MHWKVREIKIINKLKRKQQVKEWELAFVSIGLEKKMNSILEGSQISEGFLFQFSKVPQLASFPFPPTP